MSKFCLLTILTIFSLAGCKPKSVVIATQQKFTFFELAYSDGWNHGVTFRVDSNGIFFVPQTMNLLQYGFLPDSIIRLIDNILVRVLQDSSINSKHRSCEDCPLIAVIAKIGDKDIRVIQSGEIDTFLLSIVTDFKKFIKTQKQQTINATFILEAQRIVWPPPPPPRPLPKELKFITPRPKSDGNR